MLLAADTRPKMYNILKRFKPLEEFVDARDKLEEIKTYRDYIIHHGYIKHEPVAKWTEGRVRFDYWIPVLKKAGRRSYRIEKNNF